MNTINRKRICSFDLLKLFSALIVFFYHVVMDMYELHPMYNLKVVKDLLIRSNIHLAMLACGIFIFISGVTLKLNERDESVLSFYKRRLVKVLIPFYFAYIIYFIIKAITFHNIHLFGGVAKWRFIYTVFGIDEYLNAAGVATFTLGIGEWFLGCIIMCYVVYPLNSYFDKKYRLGTFVLLTIYYILINIYYDKFNFVIPSHFNFLCQVYNFYLGILFVSSGLFNKIKKCHVLLILAFAFFYLYPYQISIPDNFKVTISLLSICIAFYSMEEMFSSNRIFVDIAKFSANITFEFFLVHHFVIYEVDYLLNFRRVRGIEMIIIVFSELIIIVIISYFIKFLNKRTTSIVY